MMRALRRTGLKVRRSIRRAVTDPALDVLGAGVLGSLSGRTALLSTGAAAAFASGAVGVGFALVMSVLVDLWIHLHVLVSLRQLMAYEVIFMQA